MYVGARLGVVDVKSRWNVELARERCRDDPCPVEEEKVEVEPAEAHCVRKCLLGNHAESPDCEVA